MSNVSDIAKGRAKRPLGAKPSGDAPAGDFPPLLKLDQGERLIGTLESSRTQPSTYKKPDGSPQPDVNYYTFVVAADTGLTRPVKNDTGKIVGIEPVAVGDKVTLRGIGDLPDYMADAEVGMLLEVEFFGTHPTKSGFNFSNFGVSVFEDEDA